MLYSMTGFGRIEASIGDRQLVVELKSLNGKGFDINTNKISNVLRAYDVQVRSLIQGLLVRGTTDVNITIRQDLASRPVSINMDLAKAYYKNIHELAKELNLPQKNILHTLLQLPDIFSADLESSQELLWEDLKPIIESAAEKLILHRKIEGQSLQKDLEERMNAIESAVEKLVPLENGRMDRVRERLQNALAALSAEIKDPNRLEQEMIFYLEKMDVSEEKTRLAEHIRYFRDVLWNEETSKGKVLGFILQEIGREINTLGAKANDAGIQQIVVGMKDELEKAKEQVLNVL